MGLTTIVKVAFVKAYLNKLKTLDHGTTVAGTLAAILMASGFINLSYLLGGGTQLQMAIEIAKVLGVFTFWLVMKLIGKPVDIDTLIQEAEDADKRDAAAAGSGNTVSGQPAHYGTVVTRDVPLHAPRLAMEMLAGRQAMRIEG
jgi:hypothetical protein